jgi:LCP family protein required for cell wall assembly
MPADRGACLAVRAPGTPEHCFALRKSPVRIGRGSGNQIVLPDRFVSAVHAEIVEHAGRHQVRDLGSTNGTELNGHPLAPEVLVPLNEGDTLRLGVCTLIYRVDGANATTPHAPETLRDGRFSPAAAPPPASAPRRRGRTRALQWVLLLAAALVVLLTAAGRPPTPRLSLLVLGSDARPDELQRGESGRTDTLLAFVADRAPGGTAIISLPRDLWVAIPGFGQERVNAAYALGGPEAAKGAVGAVLGVPMQRYLLIGLQGVREVVDAAGGVEINVAAPIHDPAYPTDDYGTMVVDIPAGRQRMDGETALRYARTRHQDSDFGRVARQQQVLAALRGTLLQPVNWWRVPAVLAAVRRTTQTDLGPLDLVPLGVSLVGSPGEPERLVVGPGLVEEFRGGDGAYLLRPTPGLRRQVAVFLSPAAASVEVLNGTTTDGLARRAADRLRAGGLQAVRYGDAGYARSATSVEAGPGALRAGRYVAGLLDLSPELVHASDSLPADVDVRVTLGEQLATPPLTDMAKHPLYSGI